ncbi:MAG TPA: hypothetical protein VIC59_04475 [Gemmatimonadota bacterium]
MMPRATRTPLLAVLLGLAALPAIPRVVVAQSPAVRLITIDSLNVRPVLRKLWSDSVRENRELVACLGGELRGDTFKITRATPLESLVALPDSLGASPVESDSVSVGSRVTTLSIETCGPPQWAGTVHTHSSRIADLRYPKLSPRDRTVVSLWHERWRHDSVFCVLFEEGKPPYCEFRAGA